MALALVLVIGAALLIRTFMKLQSVDPGFDTHNVLTLAMSISADRFLKTADVAQVNTICLPGENRTEPGA